MTEKGSIGEIGKKIVGLGLGIVGVTEKKMREVASELINKGQIRREEAEGFIDTLLKRTEKDRKGMEEKIAVIVKKVAEKIPLATKKELDEIKKRLEDLEKKL